MSTAFLPRLSFWRPLWTVLAAGAAAAAAAGASVVTVAHLACAPDAVVFDPAEPPTVGLSLAQAVEAAERQSGGRATVASLQRDGWGWVYAVRLVAPSGATEVRVDADHGRIVSVSAD
jgi:uncharacterized membrane protein YkoI